LNNKFENVKVMIATDSPAMTAFDYILTYAEAAGFVFIPRMSQVRSVEFQWPNRKLNPFSVQGQAGHLNFYLRRPILNEHPGLFEAAVKHYGPVKPNALGEYRKHLHDVKEVDEMLAFLRQQGAWPSKRSDSRFAADAFLPVTAEHFLRAARRLSGGFKDHPYGPSTDYDLLFDDHRLPPKAVFGLAATEALGFVVRPANFIAGEGTVCFNMLRASGYLIIAKDEQAETDEPPPSDDDRLWAEGRLRLVTHLGRERGSGLAAAKRDRFRAEHGKLFCERCGLDPVETFGPEFGEACIEVHHRETQVAAMADGHQTQLEDLQCLCANCHRVVHRELKALTPPN
jgi:hypothetical protein